MSNLHATTGVNGGDLTLKVCPTMEYGTLISPLYNLRFHIPGMDPGAGREGGHKQAKL